MPEERFRLADYADTIREVLDSGGEFTLFPRGTSMLPLIVEGRDSVTLEKRPVRPGDIAFYRRADGSFVLHRAIAFADGAYTMCGDNQLVPEPGVAPEQVIAAVRYVTRRGKRIDGRSPGYRLYLLLWRSFLIRRIYFRLRRILRGTQENGTPGNQR